MSIKRAWQLGRPTDAMYVAHLGFAKAMNKGDRVGMQINNSPKISKYTWIKVMAFAFKVKTLDMPQAARV